MNFPISSRIKRRQQKALEEVKQLTKQVNKTEKKIRTEQEAIAIANDYAQDLLDWVNSLNWNPITPEPTKMKKSKAKKVPKIILQQAGDNIIVNKIKDNFGDVLFPPQLNHTDFDKIELKPNHKAVLIINGESFKAKKRIVVMPATVHDMCNLYKLIDYYIRPEMIYFHIYPANQPITDYKLKDHPITNCVQEILINKISQMNQVTKIARALKKITAMKITEFTKTTFDQIAKMKIPMTIHHNGGIWETNQLKNPIMARCHIFAHDNHATEYIPLTKVSKVEYVDSIDQCDLPHQQVKIYGTTKDLLTTVCSCEHKQHDIMEPNYTECTTSEIKITQSFNIKAYQHGSTLVKTYRPPDLSPKYYYCFNNPSYTMAVWKEKNCLRAPSGIYYDEIKSSDHHLASQMFFETDQTCYLYDLNKAYRSYKTSPYYQQYKLPLGNYNLVKLDDTTQNIINKVGWSKITNVIYYNSLTNKMQILQPGVTYPHPTLKFMLDRNLASFDITHTIISQSVDLDLPFVLLDTQEAKDLNNRLIGKLIQGDECTSIYVSGDQNELGAIAESAIQTSDFSHFIMYDGCVKIMTEPKRRSGLYNIHSYILSYSLISLLTGMLQADESTIVGYNVDGFYTTALVPTIIPTTEIGGFKLVNNQKLYTCHTEPVTHTQLYTPTHIPTYTHTKLNSTLTTGYPGSNKSSSVYTDPYHGSVFCVPTHTLKADAIDNMLGAGGKYKPCPINVPVYTTQKYFHESVREKREQSGLFDENVICDEVTMLSDGLVKLIIEHSVKYRYNIHFIGDLDKDRIYQLPPVSTKDFPAEPVDYNRFKQFTKLKLFGGTKVRRQEKLDCEILDSCRGKSHNEVLDIIKPVVHKISQQQAVAMFDNKTCGLVMTNKRGFELNNQIHEKELPLVNTRLTNKKIGVKGSRVQVDRNTPVFIRSICGQIATRDHEMAYFATVDSMQGATHDGKLIIDPRGNARDNALYVALTRCKRLSDVYLII